MLQQYAANPGGPAGCIRYKRCTLSMHAHARTHAMTHNDLLQVLVRLLQEQRHVARLEVNGVQGAGQVGHARRNVLRHGSKGTIKRRYVRVHACALVRGGGVHARAALTTSPSGNWCEKDRR